jgi:hypothetical protein
MPRRFRFKQKGWTETHYQHNFSLKKSNLRFFYSRLAAPENTRRLFCSMGRHSLTRLLNCLLAKTAMGTPPSFNRTVLSSNSQAEPRPPSQQVLLSKSQVETLFNSLFNLRRNISLHRNPRGRSWTFRSHHTGATSREDNGCRICASVNNERGGYRLGKAKEWF